MASSVSGYDTSANFCTKYVNFSEMRQKHSWVSNIINSTVLPYRLLVTKFKKMLNYSNAIYGERIFIL